MYLGFELRVSRRSRSAELRDYLREEAVERGALYQASVSKGDNRVDVLVAAGTGGVGGGNLDGPDIRYR